MYGNQIYVDIVEVYVDNHDVGILDDGDGGGL